MIYLVNFNLLERILIIQKNINNILDSDFKKRF